MGGETRQEVGLRMDGLNGREQQPKHQQKQINQEIHLEMKEIEFEAEKPIHECEG